MHFNKSKSAAKLNPRIWNFTPVNFSHLFTFLIQLDSSVTRNQFPTCCLLGVGSNPCESNMRDADFMCEIFRFAFHPNVIDLHSKSFRSTYRDSTIDFCTDSDCNTRILRVCTSNQLGDMAMCKAIPNRDHVLFKFQIKAPNEDDNRYKVYNMFFRDDGGGFLRVHLLCLVVAPPTPEDKVDLPQPPAPDSDSTDPCAQGDLPSDVGDLFLSVILKRHRFIVSGSFRDDGHALCPWWSSLLRSFVAQCME